MMLRRVNRGARWWRCPVTLVAFAVSMLASVAVAAGAATVNSLTIYNDPEASAKAGLTEGGLGSTVIQMAGRPPEGAQPNYAVLVVKRGDVSVAAFKEPFLGAGMGYVKDVYDWSCTDGGHYTATATFPDGSLPTKPFVIEKHPCRYRWLVTAKHLRLGEHPALLIQDNWSNRRFQGSETIRLCLSTVGQRRCSRLTQTRVVLKLPLPRRAGQSYALAIGAPDEPVGWDRYKFTVRAP